MTAVYEYKNEKITKFSESHLLGTYELVNHDNAEKDGSMLRTLRIKLEKGGVAFGGQEGIWPIKDGSHYTFINIKFGGIDIREYSSFNLMIMV